MKHYNWMTAEEAEKELEHGEYAWCYELGERYVFGGRVILWRNVHSQITQLTIYMPFRNRNLKMKYLPISQMANYKICRAIAPEVPSE